MSTLCIYWTNIHGVRKFQSVNNILLILYRYTPAAVSIKGLSDHGKTNDHSGSFHFLKKEIPTRLANMIMELRLLPEDLQKQPECAEILSDYVTSFK